VGHAFCASLEARVADHAGVPVADAVVYAVAASGGSDVRGKKVVAVEQVDREFVPYVTVVQTGTTLTFPNRDPILHHVYSFSTAKTFEIKLYTGRSPGEFVFDKPGVVTLGCNIHDWMIGYVFVVSTPYFAKSGVDGVARIRDMPAGSYDVRVWHPQQKGPAASQPLSMESNSRTTFELEVVPRKTKYKPPLDRLKY
jgi:plastocyanin